MFINNNINKKILLGILNSNVINEILKFMSPTMNYEVGQIANIPIIYNEELFELEHLVNECINISKGEWDSYELSWNFRNHPFVELRKKTIEETFNDWSIKTSKHFNLLKHNEERINENVIDLYGLKDEIFPNVSDEEIPLKKADKISDIKSFVSYAIGCALGRYSLDQEGLVYAGGTFNYSNYNSFTVDKDNIIPILSEEYFEDDIVKRFVDFVKVTFGEETLSENLDYIAETLGKKNNETAKETIRRYFINDFYKDHLQTYKNRPIYWLFTSGKLKTFNCLIYIHRYDKTTLSIIRTDYLHELQDRLDSERKSLVDIIEDKNAEYSTKEKSEAKKKLSTLDKQIDELKKYDEVLHHMADMQIEIDLDDGVKVNYDKFKGLVAKII